MCQIHCKACHVSFQSISETTTKAIWCLLTLVLPRKKSKLRRWKDFLVVTWRKSRLGSKVVASWHWDVTTELECFPSSGVLPPSGSNDQPGTHAHTKFGQLMSAGAQHTHSFLKNTECHYLAHSNEAYYTLRHKYARWLQCTTIMQCNRGGYTLKALAGYLRTSCNRTNPAERCSCELAKGICGYSHTHRRHHVLDE